jgi:hypothetical protein
MRKDNNFLPFISQDKIGVVYMSEGIYLTKESLEGLLDILCLSDESDLKDHLIREYGEGGWLHNINLAALDARIGCDRLACGSCGCCRQLWGRELLDIVLKSIDEFYSCLADDYESAF